MTYREQEIPPEADRSVLVVGLNGKVFGIHRDTGELVWTNKMPGGGMEEVFIALRYGVLVVSASGKRIFRLDYYTGKTLWEVTTTASGRATIVVEHDCIVVAKGGYIDCFEHEGKRRWKQPLKGMGLGRVAMGFPGNVAQADDPGSD
jgi:hypothetical protein